MQGMYQTPQTGKTTLKYGLIFGLTMFGVHFVLWIIDSAGHFTDLFVNYLISSRLSPAMVAPAVNVFTAFPRLLLGCVVFFLGGMVAARKTGKIETGVLTGLLAGITYSVLELVFALIVFYALTVPNVAKTISSAYMTKFVTETTISIIIGSLVTYLFIIGGIFGSLLGLLGGLVGKGQARRQEQIPYYSTPYPPMPENQTPPPGNPMQPDVRS